MVENCKLEGVWGKCGNIRVARSVRLIKRTKREGVGLVALKLLKKRQ